MNNQVKEAIKSLEEAIAHRSRIGANLVSSSPKLLVQWYEEALHQENEARTKLGEVLNAEKLHQLKEACAD